jgi:hypothetical protein
MRLAALAGVVAAATLLAGSASGAGTGKSYFRVTASGLFDLELDYGSDAASQRNGHYSKYLHWTLNAIAVWDGHRLSVPKNLLIADGRTTVVDDRTVPDGQGGRKPYECPAPEYDEDRIWLHDTKVAVLSAGRISFSSGRISADPGRVVKRNVGCAATEALSSHGLAGGPEFKVEAPGFNGSRPYSTSCAAKFKHEYTPAGRANGHSYDGVVHVTVTFARFPYSKLAKWKAQLRGRVGGNIAAWARQPKGKTGCLA